MPSYWEGLAGGIVIGLLLAAITVEFCLYIIRKDEKLERNG